MKPVKIAPFATASALLALGACVSEPQPPAWRNDPPPVWRNDPPPARRNDPPPFARNEPRNTNELPRIDPGAGGGGRNDAPPVAGRATNTLPTIDPGAGSSGRNDGRGGNAGTSVEATSGGGAGCIPGATNGIACPAGVSTPPRP